MNWSIYLVVNSIHVVYLLRLSEGEIKPLLTYLLVGSRSRLDFLRVLACLPWSLMQHPQYVLNSADRWIFGGLIIRRFDHIALIDLHWLPYSQRITFKLGTIMFKCLHGLAPAYLADWCVRTSLVLGGSALRSAAHCDIVVPSHRTDWGLRPVAVAWS